MKNFYTGTFILLSVFSILTVTAKAQQNEDLLNVLIKKNVITQQEADSIRSDQAVKAQKKLDDEKTNQHGIYIGSKALLLCGVVFSVFVGFALVGFFFA